MKRPNVFWHMIRWGFVSGTILAQMVVVTVMYMLSVGLSGGYSPEIVPLFWASLSYGVYTIPIGIIVGIVSGVLNSWAIKDILQYTPQYVTKEDRHSIYKWTFMTTIFGVLLVSVFGIPIWTESILVLSPFLSPLVAIIQTYAAHRYLLRLQRFYEQGAKEKRKGKPKHEAGSLQDALEEFEFYDVSEDSKQSIL